MTSYLTSMDTISLSRTFTNWLTGVSDRLSTLDMRVCGVPGTRILNMLTVERQVVCNQTTKEFG